MRSSHRWPLRYQILVPLALVVLVAIVTVSVVSAVFATRRAARQIEDQLKGIASTLAESSFPLTDVVLRQMHGLSGADFLLTDRESHPLASSRNFDGRLPQSADIVRHWRQLELGPPVQIGEERYFATVVAMPERGQQPPGLLHVFYPEQSWKQARNEATLPPLAIGAFALAATALVSSAIAGRLTRPILELRSQVQRIAKADYSPMPLPKREDELKDLAVAVNRLAEQLSEMERAIRRSERLTLVGQLAGGLAHHLRNNVTGAQMAVQLHERECNCDPESLTVVLRQLALIEQNLKQLLAAPQSGTAQVVKQPVQIASVLSDVIELLSASLRHRHIDLKVIPAELQPGEFLSDASQLRQLLLNLVLNGADAAGPGGCVRIAVESAAIDQQSPARPMVPHIVLRVSDNGPGPSPEIADRLFEPFVTGKPEGIGLGLAVCQQIVDSHGGRIFFRRAGGETIVEVDLPLAAEAPEGLTSSA